MSYKNILVSSMVAAAVIVAPVAAIAQTPSVSQSTGGREDAVDKKAMDDTRTGTDTGGGGAPAQGGGAMAPASGTMSSPSMGASSSGADSATPGNVAPAPGASENRAIPQKP